jgi:hypothetical protein
MTAFNAPLAGSVERYDVHLADVEFLSQQYHHAYDELVRQIHALKRANDTLSLPTVNEAKAWQRAYSILSGLRRRERKEAAEAAPQQAAFNAFEAAWNNYLQNLEIIREGLKRGIFDEQMLVEHFDLQAGDLANPVLKEANRYGNNRRHDWPEVAQRLSNALHYWHAMSSEERAVLKSERILRKLKEQKRYG